MPPSATVWLHAHRSIELSLTLPYTTCIICAEVSVQPVAQSPTTREFSQKTGDLAQTEVLRCTADPSCESCSASGQRRVYHAVHCAAEFDKQLGPAAFLYIAEGSSESVGSVGLGRRTSSFVGQKTQSTRAGENTALIRLRGC